jgi:hypothetical protein
MTARVVIYFTCDVCGKVIESEDHWCPAGWLVNRPDGPGVSNTHICDLCQEPPLVVSQEVPG